MRVRALFPVLCLALCLCSRVPAQEPDAAASPSTLEELARVKDKNTLSLPGRWETARAVGGSLAEMARFGLPDDFWATYPDRVRALDLSQVQEAASKFIHPDKMVWVVVGDRAFIESGIRELGFGEIVILDVDGNPVDQPVEKTEARD